MSDPTPAPTQPETSVTQQLDSILGGGMFGGPSSPALAQPKYQGIAGFTTASFGQTWMQMSAPGTEQKKSLPTPPAVSSQPPQGQMTAYSSMLGEKLGLQKIEIINNEVIAAGSPLDNSQACVLLHCRVTPALLEFTVRSM